MKSEKEKNKGITWDEYMLSDVIYVNPQRKLEKNRLAKYVPMEVLLPFKKYIESYYTKIFNGGIKFKNKDIIMARITPCLENGKVAYINFLGNDEVAFGSTEYIVFCEKENLTDSEYIYYLIISPEFRRITINSMTGTSGRQRVQTDILKKMKILLPSLTEQKQIGKMLSSVDEKIELNNKINNSLEQISQLIFKHWFIEFEFPNEQGKPYKSSGGEFIDSELGKIPKNWEIIQLIELITRSRETIKNKKDWENLYLIDLANMPQFSMCINNFEKGAKLDSNIYKLDKYDILYGSIRPYFGKAGFSPINGCFAGTIFNLKPKIDDFYSFLLCLVTNKKFIKYTVQYSKGTKMPIISWEDFCAYKIAIPKDLRVIKNFNRVIFLNINEISNNINENLILSQIRDASLPKLITGKIRINLEDIKES